jgi:hypothetical protein
MIHGPASGSQVGGFIFSRQAATDVAEVLILIAG